MEQTQLVALAQGLAEQLRQEQQRTKEAEQRAKEAEPRAGSSRRNQQCLTASEIDCCTAIASQRRAALARTYLSNARAQPPREPKPWPRPPPRAAY